MNIINDIYKKEYEKLLDSFSEKLKTLLKKNNMTQEDLQEKMERNGCKISRQLISMWIRKKNMPRIDKVDCLCKIFGCKRSDFI